MKWRLMTVFAALCMLIPAFVGCGKDEPKDAQSVDVAKIAGSYKGALSAIVMTTDCGTLPGEYEVKITPDATDKDDVTVTLPECSFTRPGGTMPYTIPAITLEGVDVVEKEGVYTLTEDEFDLMAGNMPVSGRLSATVAGKDIKVIYSVEPGKMGMAINFTFIGNLK